MPVSQSPSTSPEHSVAVDDHGDETASRYRFQHIWAAVTSCELLDDTRDVAEVYCEHHEDVLVKHNDGTFSGHQIKTRDASQELWKTRDAQVTNALRRFARLEADYPDHFRSFHFLTNHPMHKAEAATSLPHVLERVHAADTLEHIPGPMAKWIHDLAVAAGTSENIAFRAISKTVASSELPKLADAMTRLIQTLADCWEPASQCSLGMTRQAAQGLVDECARASALAHREELSAYLRAMPEPDLVPQQRVDGKRMTLERVRRALENGMTSTAILSGSPEGFPTPGQGSTDLLLAKLDAGGFSIVSCNSAEDLRSKADYLAISSLKRLGQTKGLHRYDHMCSLVLNDAARAYEETQKSGATFGPEMREVLRRRFQERRTTHDQLYDYSEEHMEGLAYVLTSQCDIQWSVEEPWRRDD